MTDLLLIVGGEDHPDKGPLPRGQLRGKVLLQKFPQLQRLFAPTHMRIAQAIIGAVDLSAFFERLSINWERNW